MIEVNKLGNTKKVTDLKIAAGRFGYQLVCGGAVRDAIAGKGFSDLDLFFTDKIKYIKCIGYLTDKGYKIEKIAKRDWFEGMSCVYGKFTRENDYEVDVMLFSCSEDKLISIIETSFDFYCNCCYMKDGKIFATPDCIRDIDSNTLEMASEEVSIGNIIYRAKKFQGRGFKVGGSVISLLIRRIEEVEKSPKKNANSRYVKRHNGYYTEYKLDGKKLYKDFFSIVDEDTLILAMMSNSDKIMQLAKEKYNGRFCQEKRSLLSKLKLFGNYGHKLRNFFK